MKRFDVLVLVSLFLMGCSDMPVESSSSRSPEDFASACTGSRSTESPGIGCRGPQNGPRVLFRSNRDGNPEIYGLDLTDGSFTRYTATAGIEQLPNWSPNRARLVFTFVTCDKNRPGCDATQDVHVMNFNLTNRRVFRDTDETALGFPSWVSNGKIMYTRGMRPFGASDTDILIGSLDDPTDGTRDLNCTPSSAFHDSAPDMSPVDGRITFNSDRDVPLPRLQLYLMDSCGGSVTPLTVDPLRVPSGGTVTFVDARQSAWSPDGQEIAFAGRTTGRHDLWVLNLATMEVRNVWSEIRAIHGATGRGDAQVMDWCSSTTIIADAGSRILYLIDARDGSVIAKASDQLDSQPSCVAS